MSKAGSVPMDANVKESKLTSCGAGQDAGGILHLAMTGQNPSHEHLLGYVIFTAVLPVCVRKLRGWPWKALSSWKRVQKNEISLFDAIRICISFCSF